MCLKYVTSYNSLYTSNKWNIPVQRRANSFWNFVGPHILKRCKEPKNQKHIDENRIKFMNDKYKNANSGSKSYHQKKWGDKKNQKDKKALKASGIPDHVDSTGLAYKNGAWHCYCKNCGDNKTRTFVLHEAW